MPPCGELNLLLLAVIPGPLETLPPSNVMPRVFWGRLESHPLGLKPSVKPVQMSCTSCGHKGEEGRGREVPPEGARRATKEGEASEAAEPLCDCPQVSS